MNRRNFFRMLPGLAAAPEIAKEIGALKPEVASGGGILEFIKKTAPNVRPVSVPPGTAWMPYKEYLAWKEFCTKQTERRAVALWGKDALEEFDRRMISEAQKSIR